MLGSIGTGVMKIILLSYGFVEYTIPLANALSDIQGLDVVLIEPRKRIEPHIEMVREGVTVEAFYPPRLRNPTNLITVHKLIKRINHYRPDVIHIQRGHFWFNFALPILKTYPLVVTIHDIVKHRGDRQSRLTALTNKFNIRYADKIIVHGQKLKEQMINEFKRSPESIEVIMRGDYYSFYNLGGPQRKYLQEEGHLILFFGRIWEYKGLEYLIRAEPLISKEVPDARIVIAGEGENFNKYYKMIVNKERYIILNHHIPDEMVGELFEKCCVVVLPYVEASQSGVIPLAYAFKKPVVVTNVGSLPEVVDDGETGYIVPPRDPEKLAKAIIDLLTNNEKRKRMGENAFKKTQEELSWKNVALRTVEVYKKALALKGKSVQKS